MIISLCVNVKTIAEPFRNTVTILQTQILVNLFLVLGLPFVCFTIFFYLAFKRRVRIVKLYSTALEPWKFNNDSGPFHSISIISQVEPRVNLFLQQKVWYFCNKNVV